MLYHFSVASARPIRLSVLTCTRAHRRPLWPLHSHQRRPGECRAGGITFLCAVPACVSVRSSSWCRSDRARASPLLAFFGSAARESARSGTRPGTNPRGCTEMHAPNSPSAWLSVWLCGVPPLLASARPPVSPVPSPALLVMFASKLTLAQSFVRATLPVAKAAVRPKNLAPIDGQGNYGNHGNLVPKRPGRCTHRGGRKRRRSDDSAACPFAAHPHLLSRRLCCCFCPAPEVIPPWDRLTMAQGTRGGGGSHGARVAEVGAGSVRSLAHRCSHSISPSQCWPRRPTICSCLRSCAA